MVWLGRGVFEDETDGHVDNLACFARPGVVLLTWSEDESDPQHAISRDARERLEAATDARGRPFEVVLLPSPGPARRSAEEAAGVDAARGHAAAPGRRPPRRLLRQLLPRQLAGRDAAARRAPRRGGGGDPRARCFPEREVVGVPAREILLGGGNIHCITQQVPAP